MAKTYENDKGNLIIEVSENAMEAYLTIKLTREVISEDEIKELLNRAGIVYGFENARDFNEETGFEKEYDSPFLIAKGGLEPFKSELVCNFNKNSCYNPQMDEQIVSGKDWYFVEAGTKLASIKIDESSNAVKNVHGVILEQRDLHSIYSTGYIDRNVTFKESDKAIYSTIKGYPYFKDGKLGVMDVLALRAEQVNDSQFLHFRTHVDIEGSLRNCNYIRVEGNITVHGDIEDCTIYATGNIHVDGTVFNCKPLGLISGRDIVFSSGRSSFVYAKGLIKPERLVIDSRMVAGDSILGSDKTFEISGGSCFAENYICGAYAGDRFNSSTRVELIENAYSQILTRSIMKTIENDILAPKIVKEMKKLIESIEADKSKEKSQVEEQGISFKGKVFPGVELVVNGNVTSFNKVESNVIVTL